MTMEPLDAPDTAAMFERIKAHRDGYGRKVREVWIEWAKTQPNPKPSWLVPYDDLGECDKEADRMIGQKLFTEGFRRGFDFGIDTAKHAAELAQERAEQTAGEVNDEHS